MEILTLGDEKLGQGLHQAARAGVEHTGVSGGPVWEATANDREPQFKIQTVRSRGTSPHHFPCMQPLHILPTPTLAYSVPYSLGNLMWVFPYTHLIMSFASENYVIHQELNPLPQPVSHVGVGGCSPASSVNLSGL